MDILLVLTTLLGVALASKDMVVEDYSPDAPVDKCTILGQFLLHPTNRCQYIRCTYGPEPWRDEHGNFKFYGVVRNCPIGTAVSRHLYGYGSGYGSSYGNRHGYGQGYGQGYGYGTGHGYGRDNYGQDGYGVGDSQKYVYGQNYGDDYGHHRYGHSYGHDQGATILDVTRLCVDRVNYYRHDNDCKVEDSPNDYGHGHNDDYRDPHPSRGRYGYTSTHGW